jgi:hypothetical protein
MRVLLDGAQELAGAGAEEASNVVELRDAAALAPNGESCSRSHFVSSYRIK